MLPPPRPIENKSGMRKRVRTSPISTTEFASRGKPRRNCPTSEDVPPTSTTIASCTPDRKAAPRIELVAPEAKLMTGNAIAISADMTVPSFCVMNSGASIRLAAIASRNHAIVTRARSISAAFSNAAFSRSGSPIRPSSCDSVTCASGHSSARISRARSSCDGSSGEKLAATATERRPLSRIRRAASRIPVSSNGMNSRPSYSWPPSSMTTSPRTSCARSSGQSQNGGNDALAGKPMRIAATRDKLRRCTTALTKCVVPMTTPSIGPRATPAWRDNFASAATMPPVTSSVVGVLTACTTRPSSSNTASVFVPPTSIPIRRIIHTASACHSGIGRRPRPGIHEHRSLEYGFRARRPSRRTRACACRVAHLRCARAPRNDGGSAPSREHRVEIEVVAEGARPDMLQALWGQKHVRRRQRDDRRAHAVADRLGAERIPRHCIEHADQIGRHRDRLALLAFDAPRDDPFVLKRDLQTRAAVLVEPLDDAAAAQESLGRAPRDIDDLAAEQWLSLGLIQNRRDRVLLPPLRLAHAPSDADRLRHREMNTPFLHFAARARRFAGRGDRAHLDADLARHALHPFPARYVGDDRLQSARIIELA